MLAAIQAFLRRVGLEEMIAKDFEEYVDIAIRVASDKEYRKQLSDKLKTTRMNLFNQQVCRIDYACLMMPMAVWQDVIIAWEDFFVSSVKEVMPDLRIRS